MDYTLDSILAHLHSLANAENVAGMARFGINPQGTLGISIYTLRPLAKKIGKDHRLAGELWASGIHEARILAAFIDDPVQVTTRQMDAWAADFDSWDVCDQVCCDLFYHSPLAWDKAVEWSARKEEFVKRGAFALMAGLAWHDKTAADAQFEPFFVLIAREADDGRNYVKKAVNWALRNIGKRNLALHARAIETAQQIAQQPSRSARWIASDALRELQNPKTIARVEKK
jgi:3-methyladenine DNA glycosylase AlkD